MITPSPNILVINSNQSELKRVEAFLKDIFVEYKLPEKNFNKVLLCVSEAIINSIVHGHKQKEEKKILIQVISEETDVKITITDEGEGFDITSIADPTTKSNLKKESGRGIHIIKSISDKLDFNEKGNSLQFQIKCK